MDRLKRRAGLAQRALAQFEELAARETLTPIERDAALQRFEYSCETVWKLSQLYLREREGSTAGSPKQIVRASAAVGLLDRGEGGSGNVRYPGVLAIRPSMRATRPAFLATVGRGRLRAFDLLGVLDLDHPHPAWRARGRGATIGTFVKGYLLAGVSKELRNVPAPYPGLMATNRASPRPRRRATQVALAMHQAARRRWRSRDSASSSLISA